MKMKRKKPIRWTVAEQLKHFDSALPENKDRIWKDVPGFEGKYMVSDDGHVASMQREVAGTDGKPKVISPKLLKQTIKEKNGRVISVGVNLCQSPGKPFGSTVGRLILIAFVGEQKDGFVAHYKDGNTVNNYLGNMEWSTFSQINYDAPNLLLHKLGRVGQQKRLI